MMKYKISIIGLALLAMTSTPACSNDNTGEVVKSDDSSSVVEPLTGMNVVGRVTIDGQPRQGIVVSDGVNVVTTDPKGVYQMHSANAAYVFVSVPADCSMPVSDGIPAFYKRLDFNGKSSVQCDFSLKSKAVDNSFSLLAIADVQIGTSHDVKLCEPLMDSIANYANARNDIAIGMNMGDIVWNKPTQYAAYKQMVVKINVPVLNIIGNHDHDETLADDSLAAHYYRDALGPTYYSYNIGDWHVVVLDDVVKNGNERNDYTSGINAVQLSWLRSDLSYVGKDKSIIIGLHIPTSRRNNLDNHLNGRDALYNLVSNFHRTIILSGHTHNNFTTDIASNIREYTLGAVMGAFWNEYNGVGICDDGSPRGFAVLRFTGNELVDEYYKGEEQPQSYQIKIYAPSDATLRWGRAEGTIAAPADAVPLRVDNTTVLINVFNWHTDWTVSVSEDGGNAVSLDKNVTCLDPDAVRMLQYKNSWEYRPSAEPNKHNDHNFLYTPSSDNWKNITVTARDSYGNTYTQTLTR